MQRRRDVLAFAAGVVGGGCAAETRSVGRSPRGLASADRGGRAVESSVRGARTLVVPDEGLGGAAPVEVAVEEVAGDPLFARFPSLATAIPRAAFGKWPTPVTRLLGLEAELGLGALTVKRDDVSAEPYGGGKPRKLEFLLGAALASGKRGVVTLGGVGSHHAAATAIYAQRLGLGCALMLLPQPPTDEVRRVLLTCARHGAELRLVGSLASGMRRAAALGPSYAVIAAGGSEVVGNAGFVNAGLELGDQVARGELEAPDELYVAVGTMGSAVGLAIGLTVAGLPTQIVGVRAASWQAASPREFARMHAATVAWLRGLDASFPEVPLEASRFRFEDRFLGKGYAQPTRAGAAAMERAGVHGLRLDATYTAKAFAALLAHAKPGTKTMFWHTNSQRELEDEGDASTLPPELRSYARKVGG